MTKTSTAGCQVALALLTAAAMPIAARAQTATFNIDGVEGSTTYVETELVNGSGEAITMTFTNPVEPDNVFSFGVLGDSTGSGGPLDVSSPGSNFLVSAFDLSFDAPVQIISYTVTISENTASAAGVPAAASPPESFQLTAAGVTTSAGNDIGSTGSHDVVGDFTLAADQVGTFTTQMSDNYYANIASITVAAVVPEPGTWSLLGFGGVVALGAALRKRTSAAL